MIGLKREDIQWPFILFIDEVVFISIWCWFSDISRWHSYCI